MSKTALYIRLWNTECKICGVAKPNPKSWVIFPLPSSLFVSVDPSFFLLYLCVICLVLGSSKTQLCPLVTCHLCSDIMLLWEETFFHT